MGRDGEEMDGMMNSERGMGWDGMEGEEEERGKGRGERERKKGEGEGEDGCK